GGAPNYTVITNTNGGIFGSATGSLENALNSLPGKPGNLTFDVTGVPGNYIISFIDSNAIKLDEPKLTVITQNAPAANLQTLIDGGTQGGFDNTQSINGGLFMAVGQSSSAQMSIASGTSVAISGSGIVEFANRGLPVTVTGVTVSGPGNLALLSA